MGCAYPRYVPCLFNESADLREQHDLSHKLPALLELMREQLRSAAATAFLARSPPELLGECNPDCAHAHWRSLGSTSGKGPICGVPGCGREGSG